MPITRAFQDSALADLVATGGTLDPVAVFLGLYIAPPVDGTPIIATDFTLPDPTDMPAQAVTTWGAVQYLVDGRSARQAAAKTFRLPDADNAFTAVGWYLADALTGGNVLQWGTLTESVQMNDANSAVTVLFRVTADPAGRWDALVSVNG